MLSLSLDHPLRLTDHVVLALKDDVVCTLVELPLELLCELH